MGGEEVSSYRGIGQQERGELLRENVGGPYRIPHVVGHLVIALGRRWNAAEAARGQELDLIVVVEHDATVTGDAEILEQEIAGEDVDCCELRKRVAVVSHGMFGQHG